MGLKLKFIAVSVIFFVWAGIMPAGPTWSLAQASDPAG